MSAQSFKDERMERMTGRKAMPPSAPARDPRMQGIRNPANAGEQRTQLESRVNQQGGYDDLDLVLVPTNKQLVLAC